MRYGNSDNHFTSILTFKRWRNRHIIVELTSDLKLKFCGIQPNVLYDMKVQTLQHFIPTESSTSGLSIDLHGLLISEAIDFVQSLVEYYADYHPEKIPCLRVYLIVGKGNHSDGGFGKLGPAISSLLKKINVKHSFGDSIIKLTLK